MIATCAIIAAVQNPPKRSVEPPTPRVRSWVCTCADVAFSPGSTPRMVAPAMVIAAAYTIVVNFSPGFTQNGAPPGSPAK